MAAAKTSGGVKPAASMPPKWTPSAKPMSAETARFVRSFVRLGYLQTALSVWPLSRLQWPIYRLLMRSATRHGKLSERRARSAALLMPKAVKPSDRRAERRAKR